MTIRINTVFASPIPKELSQRIKNAEKREITPSVQKAFFSESVDLPQKEKNFIIAKIKNSDSLKAIMLEAAKFQPIRA
jgi:hypothetical protein